MSDLLSKDELASRFVTLGTSHPAAKDVVAHCDAQEKLLQECEKALSQFVNRGYFDRNYYKGLLTKIQERKK